MGMEISDEFHVSQKPHSIRPVRPCMAFRNTGIQKMKGIKMKISEKGQKAALSRVWMCGESYPQGVNII
ncbi:MAG: hypothetical protein J7M32_09315 [Deltaproteobacteria bacterium]|nr:hypothetical protein [Deltaproteobacteria bacterium]OQX63844.1 MAG: hypothetical protein B5M55_06755 [Desulfococcus sp. 4484_242]